MKRRLGSLLSVVFMMTGVSYAQSVAMAPLPELGDAEPAVVELAELPLPEPQKATLQVVESDDEEEAEPIPVKTGAPATMAEPQSNTGNMQIEATDPKTGETFNISINSDELTYDPQTGDYILTGEVYIIIPEKSTEILADRVTYNAKSANMMATGNVFIIKEGQVIGTERAKFDFEQDISSYFHPRTVMEDGRMIAESAIRSPQVLIVDNGTFIVDGEAMQRVSQRFRKRGLRMGQGAIYSFYTASRGNALLSGDISSLVLASGGSGSGYNLDDAAYTKGEPSETVGKPISPNDVVAADFSPNQGVFQFKVKTVNITTPKKGFDEIVFKQAVLKYKNFPVGWSPNLDFGYIPDQSFMTYLGPDVGYNVDYGGAFVGPGWQKQMGKGWFRFSPILTYGGGKRLRATEDDIPQSVGTQAGWGVLGHFRSPGHHSDFGYSGTMREPFFIGDQVLFGRNQTRLRGSLNQYYTNAFFGQERPHYLADLTDYRLFQPGGNWMIRTFASAGVAEDEFFPTRQNRYFVLPTSASPITTMRLQFQGQVRSSQPLLYLGNWGAASLLAQTRLSYYGTGDFYGIFQGGPFINVVKGPVFSQVRYFYSQVTGSSPFVFDSYFQGRNNLQTINSIDLGKYVTVGATHSLSLSRDNARDDMLVGQRFFISVGSKNLRFSAAFDTIQQRSFFGLTFNPEGGQMVMDFDKLNKFDAGFDPGNVTIPNIVP